MESNYRRLKNNIFFYLEKKDALRLMRFVNGAISDAKDIQIEELKKKLPKMKESSEVADKHYTVDYDELSHTAQQEYEGIMHGWQDCIIEMNKVIENDT